MTRMIKSFICAAFSLALSATSALAFDTPYLTFRSASSFTLSATKRWDGTLQKATSNPTDEASWSDWTGSSISAGLSDGQYYIYLRGTGNTYVNNSYSAWTLTGSNIYCEGDIETLRGYDGNVPEMAESCYKCMFSGCTALKSIPILSATTVPNYSYYQMFKDCTGLEVNTSGPGVEWAIPSGTVGTSIWNYEMFSNTSGSFTGNPVAGTTYYVASALPLGEIYQITGKGTIDSALVGFSATINLSSTVKNGTAPYTFALVSGTLPPGLNLSGSTLAGTPTTAGNYSFSLSVTDSESHTLASAAYTMQVVQPTVVSTTFVGADGSSITTNCITLTTAMTTLNQSWYVVSGTLNYGTGGIKVSGDVNLVLADGASMTVQGASKKAGVNVAPGDSLTIYGQSEGTGVLNASGNSSDGFDFGGAGIGGNDRENGGTITINGGTVTATGGGYCGAGIGGGKTGNGGTVTINGGTVTAQSVGSYAYGAGIGGGQNGSGGNVTINGGMVTATAGPQQTGTSSGATGIGRGCWGASVGTLTVGQAVSVKAGSTANPTGEIGRGGSITIGNERYFFVEKLSLMQTENLFASYVNEPKSWNLLDTLTGGTTPYSLSLKSGSSLPAGLVLDGTTITGKVAVANTYTFTYTVTDSSATPLELDATYTLTVTAPDPISAQTDLGAVKVGKSKSVTLSDTISGGVPPYTFDFNGAHDAAFSLSAGELTITPSAAQTYTCTITVTDILGNAQNITYSVVAVESAGFTDDDPEEPETGDSVNCLTPDGTFSRTCNQVVNSSSTVTWEDSWYYVTGNVTLSAGAIVKGKVSLILCDNATLTVSGAGYPSYLAGITVTNDNALTIYAQSTGENAGSLVASAQSYSAAIGGGRYKHAGKINIYGGNITATGGFYGAGIGGGQDGNGGNLTIYGGVVNATGYFSPGIGGGNGGNGGAVAVYGGTVNASGGEFTGYPGIGAYGTADQGTLTVGATITVKAGESATLTDADIKNPNGETNISLANKYHYFYIENTGPKPLTQTTSTFAAYVDDSFEATLAGTVSGGTSPYTFVQKSGTLPTGLSFANGVISGTPTTAGSATVVFTVSDSGTGSDAQTEDFTYTITVTAKPKKITYYNGAVEITGLTPSNYVEGVGATLAATAPAATGYAFAGWYDNSGLTGNAVTTISASATGDKEFWARFTPVKYTISYWDGSSLMSGLAPSNYTIEAAATLPATATKAGYGFYGWYTTSGLTGERVYTIPAGSTGVKSFYAKWGVIKTSESYVDGNGNSQSADCVELGSTSTTLSEEWYVVKGNVSISGKVTVSGDVKILLADDATLTVNSSSYGPAIEVKGSNKLTIYTQSKGNGALNVTASSGPGIGSNDSSNPCGTITIYGGDITVTGSHSGIGGGWDKPGGTVYVYGGNVTANGGSSSSGIGGSYTHLTEGSLTVGENVIVKATSDSYGSYVAKPHGVGGAITLGGEQYYRLITPKTASVSYRNLAGTEQTALCKMVSEEVNALADGWYAVTNDLNLGTLGMTVSGSVNLILADGASLVVTGANKMAAINVPSNSSLTVWGQFGGTGSIFAQGGNNAAGIGGTNGVDSTAFAGWAGTIVVNGGEITAQGNGCGAGIGGGNYGGCVGVTVNGGTVTATGGSSGGAGIGGGYYGGCIAVTLNGGTVTAAGSTSYGAGIGGGYYGGCGTVTISGGTVTATGGSNGGAGIGGGYHGSGDEVTISGGTVTATGGSSAAGIGGGTYGDGFDVTVTGGDVIATGGSSALGIGKGAWASSNGTLTVSPTIVVKAGSSANPQTEITPDSENRITLDSQRYVTLESTEAQPLSQKSSALAAYAGEVTDLPLAGTVQGGIPPYTFAFDGDHPAGVTLSDARTLSVAASVAEGEYTFRLTVTDSDETPRVETYTYKLTLTTRPTQYSITYMHGSSQIVGLEPSFYPVGVGTNLPSTNVKNGYTLQGYGWYDNAALEGNTFFSVPADATGDKVFYGDLRPITYRIYYYNPNGTAISGLTPTNYTVESSTIILPTPTPPEGKDFAGWYTNYTLTGVAVTSIPSGSYDTKQFYAKWVDVEVPVEAVPVEFVDADGTAKTTNCVPLAAANAATLSTGWYAVTNSLALDATIEIAGNVKLVLCDGVTLTVSGSEYKAGVYVPVSSTLTIYAQGTGTGALTATGGNYGAGIGGRSGSVSDATQGSAGTIVINGGVITATSGGDFAAGIGGGSQGNGANVTVNRGLVTATGGANAPGIGGGYSSSSNGSLKVPSTMLVKAGSSANPTDRLEVDPETGVVSFEGKPKYFVVKTKEGEAPEWAITYMDGEDTITTLSPKKYIEGIGVAELPAVPAKAGYTAGGWYGNAGLTGDAVTSISSSATGVQTLWAKYTPIAYTITYKDGTTTMTGLAPASYTAEASANLPTPTPPEGKTFSGWYDNSGLTGSAVTSIPAGSTGNKTFYVKWNFLKSAEDYIDAEGNLVSTNCAVVTSDMTTLDDSDGGWYIVKDDVSFTDTLTVSGDVNLILADGATLTVTQSASNKAGIGLESGNTLTIYSQSAGTGALVATGGSTGIGGNWDMAGGSLVVYGGSVTASTGYNGRGGIGGSYNHASEGSLKVGPYARVTVQANNNYGTTPVKKAVAPDGTVALESERYYWIVFDKVAAVSYRDTDGTDKEQLCKFVSSENRDLDNGWYAVTNDLNLGESGITVAGSVNLIIADGASLVVTGASNKAGINVPTNCTLTIYGQAAGTGVIDATGGSYAPGIGGNKGDSGDSTGLIGAAGTIVINGGVITAQGGFSAAGIGGGTFGNGGTIVINDGTVSACGNMATCPGIGAKGSSNQGTLTVGESITVKAGSSSTLTDADIKNPNGETSISLATNYRYYLIGKRVPVVVLLQTTSELSAYANETKNWDLADTIADGTTPYSFTLKSGSALPAGLALNGTSLGGSVAAAGVYSFTYVVTDSSATPATLDATYTLTVTAPDPIVATRSTLFATVGKEKSFALADTIAGGIPPYVSFALASGSSAPAGFSLSDGVISGTAASEFSHTFTVAVTDSIGTIQNIVYTLEAIEDVGFIEDDPESPDEGVLVDCMTADGVVRSRVCHPVTSTTLPVTWEDSWYYVTGSVTLSRGVVVNGKVSLVLADNATLTVSQNNAYNNKAGINVTTGNSLVIYAQSTGGSAGTMIVTADDDAAGIGGDKNQSCGKVTIYGGNVTARTGASSYFGAGIGGGQNGNGGTVNIYGGAVVAQAYFALAGGAGIGGGGSNTAGQGGNGGTVNIYGGTVTALSGSSGTGSYGAGIGGGKNGNGGTVRIEGGTVTASTNGGSTSGYGVGRGYGGTTDGELTVGGNVDVTAGANEGSAAMLSPVASGTYKYFHFEPYVATPIVQVKGSLAAYVGDISLSLVDTVSGGRTPYTFSGTMPEGLSLASDGTLTGTLAAGTYNFTATVTDAKNASQNFAYILEVVEHVGFIDDDPEEPVNGDMVQCRTADGVLRYRTCNQVVNSTTAVTWSDSWYYVTGNVTLTKGVTVSGKVSLVLGDNATLTINGTVTKAGINVTNDNSLVIYGQNNGNGALVATGGSSGAGIGGDRYQSCGKVVIYGGSVTASGSGSGAGIGGGNYGGTGGTVIINGGTVAATGDSYGAGIGGGGNGGGNGGAVTINGGTVTATGGSDGAGIGGGGDPSNGGNGGTVTINGGEVTATGGTGGAGIGGGRAGAGGTVTINGGTVRAMSSVTSSSSLIPTGIGKGNGSELSSGTLTVAPGTTVKTGFSADSTLTTQTPVNNVVTIGTGTSYRYFEIDGPRPMSLLDGTLASALTGGQSSWTLSDTIDGGIPPFTFAEKVANSIPSGLSLINGVLTGRPSAAGNYVFTLTVTDSVSNSIDAEYTLVVSDPPAMSVSLTDLGSVTTNANMSSIDLSSRVSGGIPSYRFALKSGSSLPAGLYLSSAGELSGRPTQPNNYSFVVTVTDSALPANTYDATLTLAVKAMYSITYYDGETKLSPASEYKTYVEGEYKTLSYAPTKSGYLFIGWRDGQGNTVTRIEDTDTGNKTFYAVWEERVATKSVTFIGADGNEQTETCTVIYDDASTTLASGWYVARGSVSFSGGLTIDGTTANPVHLVLEDGCTLAVTQSTANNAGISVATGKALVIYGQSGNTGTLNVTGGTRGAGIGGGRGEACGTVTINGGTVNTTGGSQGGAGIGGGYYSGGNGGNGGTVTINGGNVVAIGNNAAGIGGGRGGNSYTSGNGGAVTITGGNVTATGGGTCAGIGGAGSALGTAGNGGTVTISGGTVIATGNNRGAGIGGGYNGSGGNVTITGGRVTATGGEQVTTTAKYVGAGIGAGYGGASQGTLTVANVIVKAGDSENPETELTPSEGLVTLGGEQYYVVADESAGVISPIVYMSGSETLTGLTPANYEEGQGADITTAVPTKTGYTFTGWYDNADLEGEPATAVSAEATGTQTFYADWTLTNYTITYIDQDGTTPITGLLPTSYTIETETFTLPAPAAPAGKMFDGWYTANDFSTPDVSAITKGTSGNKTYYAKWLSVETTSVTFVGADGNEQTEQCRPLAVGISELRNGGWYVVNSSLDYRANGGLTVHGVANLVLADGASLVVTGSTQMAGITVTPGNVLNIYAQSAGTGRLEAYGGMNSAGIGGSSHSDNGTVNIYGGVVSANGKSGAGIGGGDGADGGTVNIYGGTVTASGVSMGAGIGGGANAGNGGAVTINGGTVTAIGGHQAAGIGGGYKGISQSGANGGTVRINGGTVVAIGGFFEGAGYGAGIGAANGGSDQGELFVGDGMTAFAGASENPSAAPERDPVTGEVVLSGERYYTVAPTSYDTSFSITYINGAQTLTGILPDAYSSGAGTNLPTAVEMVRNGATFGGWYETPDFSGEAVTAIEPGSTGEKTFYAKWTASYIAMDGTAGVHDCTEMTSSTTTLTGGWYVVTGAVELDSTLPVTGSANLILADGASLSVSAESLSVRSGIEIASGKTLTVYGQAGGTGVLGAKAYGALSGIDGTLAISARMVAKGGSTATSTLYPMARDASTGIVTLLVYGNPNTYVTVRTVLSNIVYKDGETPIQGLFPTNYYEGTGTALPTEAEVTKEGYTFDGWYATYDFSMLPATNIDANATGTQTFYAKFTPHFVVEGGVLIKINPKLSGTITIPDTVRKIGGERPGESLLLWDSLQDGSYNVTGLVIPSTVTNISDFAFSHSEKLTTVTIPEGVRYIGYQAFANCTNLTELTLPKGIEIAEAAFFRCTSLESVNISGTVVTRRRLAMKAGASGGRLLAASSDPEATTVGDYAFLSCGNLQNLKIGRKVEDIGGGAFSGCSRLNVIEIEEGNDNFMSVDGMFLTKDGTTLISAFGTETEITVTNSVVTIQAGAFAGYSTLTNVVLQSGVETIGEAAFSNATQLATITIPSTVTAIDTNAFCETVLATVYVAKGDTARVKALVERTGYAAKVTYVEPGGEPSDWPADTSEVAAQTAEEAFGITEGPLTNVNAKALADWAKDPEKGNVGYAEMGSIIPEAFLLNCANNAAAVATATEVAKEDIKITAITFDSEGNPVLWYENSNGETVILSDDYPYGNGEVVLQGSATIGASASWHDEKQSTDRFFRTTLKLK